MSTSIALSRRQKVFAVRETTPGTLVFPTAADFIRPAGDAVLNQTPAYMDSKEKADTLDLLDQFTNAMPAGEWSFPMYLRLLNYTTAPQGAMVLESLLGGYQASGVVTAALDGAINDSVVTLNFETLADGFLPPIGVITIGTEKIKYTTLTLATATTGTLAGLTRGYGGTTAASHIDTSEIRLSSQVFYPTVSAPSFSLWIQTDHFVQFLTGVTANNSTVSVKNEDGVTFNLKGQGMQMGWAGTDALDGAVLTGATSITVEDGDKFCVGARIHNKTAADHATAGYKITAIVGDTLTITPGVVAGAGWADGDVIAGYLPDPGTLTTSVIENRKAAVKIGGVAGKLRSTDITIDTPKNYLTDEVGTAYPAEYVEDMRKISFSMNSYFKAENAGKFRTAYNGEETTIEIAYGDTAGKIAALYMKRVKLNVPTQSFDGATVSLNIPATALGTTGEDSLYIITM